MREEREKGRSYRKKSVLKVGIYVPDGLEKAPLAERGDAVGEGRLIEGGMQARAGVCANEVVVHKPFNRIGIPEQVNKFLALEGGEGWCVGGCVAGDEEKGRWREPGR